MKNVYCLSGLGADHRIFQNLHIAGNKLVHLPWVPFDKHDDMCSYAQKMQVNIAEEKPTVLGVSFGGMLAVEMAKKNPTQRTIIISSAKGKRELPDRGLLLPFLVHHNLIPYGFFKKPNSIMYDQFGAETEAAKNLLAAIMQDTDTDFLKRAFKVILDWQNMEIPKDIIHIHGTADKIIPPAHIEPDYWIDGGQHLMVFNKAEVISRIVGSHV